MSALLDQLRAAIRTRHFSRRTEEAYVRWAYRYIRFHGTRHPADLGAREVGAYLSHLAAKGEVAASTQNQALAALLSLVLRLLYGSGLRLLEALRLRVKDLDFEERALLVRAGKGAKDRITMLPDQLLDPLVEHLRGVRALHQRDLASGIGGVYLRSRRRSPLDIG